MVKSKRHSVKLARCIREYDMSINSIASNFDTSIQSNADILRLRYLHLFRLVPSNLEHEFDIPSLK